MNTPADLSRRNFLKLTATAAAGLAVSGFIQPAFASNVKVKKLALDAIPEDAVEIAKSSELVQSAWNYLLGEINSLHDAELKEKVLGLYSKTAPSFMERYQSLSSVKAVYQKLFDAGLVDPKLTSVDKLFPPLKDPDTNPQPFFSAPGSGYGSHHSYPGGLVTHTAVNVEITKSILSTYSHIMDYEHGYDIAVAGQLLHDLAKPWVFQWQKDGSSFPEYTIAGTGAHHIFSVAEAIYRNLPSDEVVAQACAHDHPGSKADEDQVVNWIKAASILAGVEPVSYGLLSADAKALPTPHQQAGYIVHLGDHDWVLSVPAAQQSVAALKQVAAKVYGMSKQDLNSIKFNKFRNYIGAQYSFMHVHQTLSTKDPFTAASEIASLVVGK